MNNEQFEHAISLTSRITEKSIAAARLHLVDGMTITEAADAAGVKKQSLSRTVATINKKIEGVVMSAKKLGIYLAEDSLEFLALIQDRNDDNDDGMTISSAVNLAVQVSKMIALDPLRLTANELLLCCDVHNGGARLAEFETPDSVSILRALESMKYSVHEGMRWEDGICQKWDVDEQSLTSKIELMSEAELFALAMATRHFWSKKSIAGKKALSECSGYQEWAKQWVEE